MKTRSQFSPAVKRIGHIHGSECGRVYINLKCPAASTVTFLVPHIKQESRNHDDGVESICISRIIEQEKGSSSLFVVFHSPECECAGGGKVNNGSEQAQNKRKQQQQPRKCQTPPNTNIIMLLKQRKGGK